MLDISDMEVRKMIYMTVIFGLAYLLIFILYRGITKKEPKSK